jgi:hypothetical protein
MIGKKILRVGAALLLVAVGWASSPMGPAAAAPAQYFVDESKLPFTALPGLDTDRHWGVHSGAGYRIEVPKNWNGRLVLWAHGYRGTTLELTVDNHPLRPFLIANGYAWAASTAPTTRHRRPSGFRAPRVFNGIVSPLAGGTPAPRWGQMPPPHRAVPGAFDGDASLWRIARPRPVRLLLDCNLMSGASPVRRPTRPTPSSGPRCPYLRSPVRWPARGRPASPPMANT